MKNPVRVERQKRARSECEPSAHGTQRAAHSRDGQKVARVDVRIDPKSIVIGDDVPARDHRILSSREQIVPGHRIVVNIGDIKRNLGVLAEIITAVGDAPVIHDTAGEGLGGDVIGRCEEEEGLVVERQRQNARINWIAPGNLRQSGGRRKGDKDERQALFFTGISIIAGEDDLQLDIFNGRHAGLEIGRRLIIDGKQLKEERCLKQLGRRSLGENDNVAKTVSIGCKVQDQFVAPIIQIGSE